MKHIHLIPQISEDDQVLAGAVVTEQVGIAQPQLELVQSGGAHVCGEEVVQSRRHGYALIDVRPLQDGSERERRDRRHICRGRTL